MRRQILTGIDAILGWKSRLSGAVTTGRGSTIAWRRIRRAAGNTLSIGEDSIVHADIKALAAECLHDADGGAS